MADYGLGSWPSRRARIKGDSTAFVQGARSIPYGELADRVERLALGFSRLGVGHGDRVAYLGPNDIATWEVFFATCRIGAVFAPFNIRLAVAEIGYLLDDAQPTVLVHGPELADLVAELDPAAHGVATVLSSEASGAGTCGELIDAVPPGSQVFSEVGLADDAVILYTSGTTGRPKGAVLTHGNVTFNTMNQLAHVDVLTADVALCMSPLFHATGLGQVSLPTLFKGGTVVIMPKFDPGVMLATVAELHVTCFSAVPTMLQMLCDHPDFATTDLSSLRYVIYGGSPIAERVAVAWQARGVDILQGYGMTEASPGVYLATRDGARQRPVSIGVPHFFTDVSLGSVAGQPGPEASGELLVRGLNVFRGYWNRPQDTQDALGDGWFRSGDVVRVAADGWAHVVDRVKDMIISGGENIYPAEVEAAINALPGIVDSAVIAIPDERWGEVGLAFVLTSDGTWTPASVRDALLPSLAAFKVPKEFRFVSELPRTATGKIRKQVLRTDIAQEAQP
jgi:fatty-acyl-CoA synthase